MRQQSSQFKGTGVALVTPFNKYGEIDYQALKTIIEHTISGGVDFVVSLGTTGEAITLSSKECLEVLAFTIRTVDGRVPVVAGYFGGNYTEKLVNAIKGYNFDGVDAIMSSSPAYSKPPQEGIYQHFMRIAEVSPRPIIIYNVPGRTSSNMIAETTLRLAEASDKFVAVKEASGDIIQASNIIKHAPEDFLVLSGDDPITLPMISLGGQGAISVIANVFPDHFSSMVRTAMQGDYMQARKLHEAMLDVHPLLYVEGNPVGIKAAMEIQQLCSKHVRVPLVPLSDPSYQALEKILAKVPEPV